MRETRTQANADDMPSAPGRQPRSGAGEWTLWLIVAAIGAHIIEEHALNFNGWAARFLHAPVSSEDFHLTNGGRHPLLDRLRRDRLARPGDRPVERGLVFVNALGFHLLSSLLVRSYSPGTLSSVVLFVPAGRRRLPRRGRRRRSNRSRRLAVPGNCARVAWLPGHRLLDQVLCAALPVSRRVGGARLVPLDDAADRARRSRRAPAPGQVTKVATVSPPICA